MSHWRVRTDTPEEVREIRRDREEEAEEEVPRLYEVDERRYNMSFIALRNNVWRKLAYKFGHTLPIIMLIWIMLELFDPCVVAITDSQYRDYLYYDDNHASYSRQWTENEAERRYKAVCLFYGIESPAGDSIFEFVVS